MRPAVFLDRDGTILVERHYLSDPDDVELLPGVIEALRALRGAGLALVIVTNQSGIGRGYFSEEDYGVVTRRMETILAEAGVTLDGTYHCPHAPEHLPPCECRKPRTGMYRTARAELDVALEGSWYVGDRVRDVLPAIELGGTGVLVRTGYGRGEEKDLPASIVAVDDLGAAADRILGSAKGSSG